MIPHLRESSKLPIILASIASVGSSFTVTSDVTAVVIAIVTTVTLVVAVISYIDRRIESKIASFAEIQKGQWKLLDQKINLLLSHHPERDEQ